MGLDWIGTYGGPMVVLHAATADAWDGAADDRLAGDDVADWGDYRRACGVEGYHGIVEYGPSGAHRALVLGDEPLDSAFLAERRCIVRWCCADSEAQLLAMVEDQLPTAPWESDLDWEVPSGGLVMIDAVCPIGDYAPGGSAERNPVVIDLPPGQCHVEAARVVNADGSAEAVVHRFTYR